MSVDAELGVDAETGHELHLAGGGEIKESTLLQHRADHGRVRQGLERIVQIHAGERLLQLPILRAHTLAIDDEQR